MTQVSFGAGFISIAVDEPFYKPDALIDLIPGEQVIAAVTVNVDNQISDAVWLMGEIGWRITSATVDDARGRIRLQIKRNGIEIYRQKQDAYIPAGFQCKRSVMAFMHADPKPGSDPVTYELIASAISSDNLDWFKVVGPVAFFAGGMKKMAD